MSKYFTVGVLFCLLELHRVIVASDECGGETGGPLQDEFKCGKKTFVRLRNLDCSGPRVYYTYPSGEEKRLSTCDATPDCTNGGGVCIMYIDQRTNEHCYCYKMTIAP